MSYTRALIWQQPLLPRLAATTTITITIAKASLARPTLSPSPYLAAHPTMLILTMCARQSTCSYNQSLCPPCIDTTLAP